MLDIVVVSQVILVRGLVTEAVLWISILNQAVNGKGLILILAVLGGCLVTQGVLSTGLVTKTVVSKERPCESDIAE